MEKALLKFLLWGQFTELADPNKIFFFNNFSKSKNLIITKKNPMSMLRALWGHFLFIQKVIIGHFLCAEYWGQLRINKQQGKIIP